MLEPAQTTRPQKALITGGTGFIGSHLTRHLRAAGWFVHLLVRPDIAREEQVIPGIQLHTYTGETEDVVRAVASSRPDVVFHLASLFLAQHTPQQIAPLIQSNVLLGTQLLEAMSAAGVRFFVNTGTSWQYFHDQSFRPVNLYASTKQAFEDILAYYADAVGVRVITLSLFDSYGPADSREKLLRLLMDCLQTGQPLQMSPGDQIIDLVHVDDLCAAFLHAGSLVTNPGAPAMSSYAISGEERMTLRQLVAVLEQEAGVHMNIKFGVRPYRPREIMKPWSGQAMPGWKPRITIREGLRQLLRERLL